MDELEDDLPRALSSVEAMILPLCAPSETMQDERFLLYSCRENRVDHLENKLFQRQLNLNDQICGRFASCLPREATATTLDGPTFLQTAAHWYHQEAFRVWS